MKKTAALLMLTLFTGCNNNSATDEPLAVDETVSLNEIAKPVSEVPVKKEMIATKKHEIAVTVPDGTWKMAVQKVLETETETAVVVALSQAEGVMGIQVISELTAAVEFASEKPVKIYVIGKSWNWENHESYEFVDKDHKFTGRPIEYQVLKSSRKSGPKKQRLDNMIQ